jgi:hypothetical protein
MNALPSTGICWFFTAWIAFSALDSTAGAADNPWSNRPGSVLAPSDVVIAGSGGATAPANTLNAYWESRRQNQRDTALQHSAARYGDLGPHYSVPVPYSGGAIGPREFFGPGCYSGSCYPGSYYSVSCHDDCGYTPGLALSDCLYGINHFGRHRGPCPGDGCPRLFEDFRR